MASSFLKIKPVIHFLSGTTVGAFAIKEAYSHSGTTQTNLDAVKNDHNLRKQIMKRHNTMTDLGVSMEHMHGRFNGQAPILSHH